MSRQSDSEMPINDKNVDETHKKRKLLYSEWFLIITTIINSSGFGMPIGYSAILLPQLKENNDTMVIDDDVGSWIASMLSVTTTIGSFFGGFVMDYYGRKFSILLATFPLVIGSLMTAFSNTTTLLMISRAIVGLSIGIVAVPGQVYLGEVSEPHFRGMITSLSFSCLSLGILIVYALGTYLDWRTVAGLSVILPIISFVAFLIMPESPVFLYQKGKEKQAEKALNWFRNDQNKAKNELDILKQRHEEEKTKKQTEIKENYFKMFFERKVFKPFLILNVYNILQTLCGTYMIVFYAVDIINSMGIKADPFLVTILTGVVRFIFSIISTSILGKIGTRNLALISAYGTTVFSIFLAIFLYVPINLTKNINFLAPILILLYVAFNTLGYMVLPGVMISELLPQKSRGFLGGISFTLSNIELFIAIKYFPLFSNFVGIEGAFVFFGIISFIASVFLYVMFPETKEKTLNQIEDYFAQENFTWIGHKEKTPNISKLV